MTVAARQILLIHQDVDRFRHAVDAEHGDEAILIQQPFLDQEAVEETGLLVQEGGAHRDQLGREAAVVGQQATEEVIDPLCLLGDSLEGDAHQGVGTTGLRQGVVAADDAKPTLVEGIAMDRVVGDVRLAALGDILHRQQQQIVGSLLRIVEEGEVGGHLLELVVDAQDQAADAVVIGADVDVHEGVRQHPIQIDPEPFQLAVESLVIQLADKGEQQLIEPSQPDRHAGDGRNMVIEDAQGIERFIEISRRCQLQPG